MKKNDLKNVFIALAIIALFLYSENLLAQDINTSQIEGKLLGWGKALKRISQLVIAICSIGGGLYSYFKVQTDDGGAGKKAIGNFVLALLFGSTIIVAIELFFPDVKF